MSSLSSRNISFPPPIDIVKVEDGRIGFIVASLSSDKMSTKVRSSQAAAIPRSFLLYGKILNGYNRIGMVPLVCVGGQIKANESNGVWLATEVAFIWANMVFLNVQCARYLLGEGPTMSKLFLIYQTSVYSTHAVSFSVLVFHPHLIAAMLNNSLELQRRHDGPKDKGKVPCLVMKVTLFLTIFGPLAFGARIIKDPKDTPSLLSLSANPTEVAWQWEVICSAYQLYSLASITAALWLSVSTVTVFLTTLTKIIRTIKKTGNECRVKGINETTMLVVWFNSIFRHWTVVMEALFIWVLVIILTFTVIRQSIRNLLIAGCAATMMVYLYRSMGAIYEESKDIMNVTMPGTRYDSWFKRKRRAY